MNEIKLFSITQVHVDATRQAGVEAAHCTHDVDALEVLRAVLLEDGGVLYRVLVGARSPIDITHTAVPGCWRIGMIIGNLAILDHEMMGKNATYRFVEAAANGLFRYREAVPGLGASRAYLGQRLVQAVQGDSG